MMQTNTIAQPINLEVAQQRFVTKVFWWMFIALLTTAGISYYVASNQQLLATIITNQMLFFGLIIAELGLVLVLSAAINRLSAMAATGLFFLYSALTGLTLSVVFIAYTAESLVTTFLITSGTFGAMAIYGYTTRKDLTSIGNICFMGLIGIIIASVVNFFFRSTLLHTAVTYIGVLVFVGLTAYDAQKIKQMGLQFEEGSEAEHKGAILGALRLYLDFINLFLLLLRIFGRRR
ncbi:MAG: Bax inhibitor-1/YccA family protein [Pseudomonadota bacterium]